MGKKQEIKAKRKRSQNIQKGLTIFAIVLAAALFVGFLIYPSLKPAVKLVMPASIGTFNSKDMTLGDPAAPLKVEVFSDFQCPACGYYVQDEEANFIKKYVITGKVQYIFRPYSFLGEESKQAAEAAYCAMEQGNFWDYHEIIYFNMPGENTGALDDARLTRYATSIGLNEQDFKACLQSDRNLAQVEVDNTYADTSGVTGTPYFKVGDQVVSYKDLIATVDAALAK
jgi:protein-disulfide isomerase